MHHHVFTASPVCLSICLSVSLCARASHRHFCEHLANEYSQASAHPNLLRCLFERQLPSNWWLGLVILWLGAVSRSPCTTRILAKPHKPNHLLTPRQTMNTLCGPMEIPDLAEQPGASTTRASIVNGPNHQSADLSYTVIPKAILDSAPSKGPL